MLRHDGSQSCINECQGEVTQVACWSRRVIMWRNFGFFQFFVHLCRSSEPELLAVSFSSVKLVDG